MDRNDYAPWLRLAGPVNFGADRPRQPLPVIPISFGVPALDAAWPHWRL